MLKLDSVTAYALIAANVIPLVGVALFDWSLALVMVLYWLENVVIGVYTFIKMVFVISASGQWQNLFKSLFFCVHYGLFCSGHGAILFGLLEIEAPDFIDASFILLQPLALFQFLDMTFGYALLLGLAALILSHGFSMFEHFFQRGEKAIITFNKLMMSPYPRIIILHVAIIGGALLIETLGSPTYLLVALVVVKIIMDVKLHLREHAKNAAEVVMQD